MAGSRWLAGPAFAAAFSLSACEPPDRPPLLSAVLPESVLRELHPEGAQIRAPERGITFLKLWSSSGPWAIHLLRIDLSRCELGLQVLRAPVQDGMEGGRERVSELLRAEAPWIVGAVNGDFFTPEGLPVGTEIASGQLRRVGTRPALAWRPGRDPWLGVPSREGGSVLRIGWLEDAAEPYPGTQVVGGFPLLLKGGVRVGDLEVTDRPSFAAQRHPRTAVGFDPEAEAFWILEVDGRQPGYSEGMTLPELTVLLAALGATEALNLDGGGSSVMILEKEVVSRPSDPGGEREVVNALAVRKDPGLCLLQR